MRPFSRPLTENIRLFGAIFGLATVASGCIFMVLGKAPDHYILINMAAAVAGSAFLLFSRAKFAAFSDPFLLLSATILLAASIFGPETNGMRRWIPVGPILIQPALIVVPAMLVTFTRKPSSWATCGVIVAAIALALQPDRAVSGALLVGLGTITAITRDKHVFAATLVAAIAWIIAMLRPDSLPAVAFVEGVYLQSFQMNAAMGILICLGALAMLAPIFVGWRKYRQSAKALPYLAALTCWLGLMIAALLGNYPTPLVGYGASAILGYFLSLIFLEDLSSSEGEII